MKITLTVPDQAVADALDSASSTWWAEIVDYPNTLKVVKRELFITTPSIDALKRTARNVLEIAANSPRENTIAATGGFVAYKFTWDGGSTELRLGFEPWTYSASFRPPEPVNVYSRRTHRSA